VFALACCCQDDLSRDRVLSQAYSNCTKTVTVPKAKVRAFPVGSCPPQSPPPHGHRPQLLCVAPRVVVRCLQARFLGAYHSIHGDSRHMVKRKIDVSSGFTILPPDPFKSPRTLP
jgi:hypothetical protein